MIVMPLLLLWAFVGMHESTDCWPAFGLLHEECTAAGPGFVAGASIVRGAGVLGPFLRTDPDPLRAQRMADQRRMDALLRGEL